MVSSTSIRQMKVILFGATGMVGKAVLRQCLLDPNVESVLSIGRKASGVSHPKLRDIDHDPPRRTPPNARRTDEGARW